MLRDSEIRTILEKALSRGADFAELYFEDREDASIGYDSDVNEIATLRSAGGGLTLIQGARSVYVCTSELTQIALLDAVDKAAVLLSLKGGSAQIAPFRRLEIAEPCPVIITPGSVGFQDKIAILRESYGAAMAVTPALRHIELKYFDRDQRVRVVNTEGVDAEDRRVTVRLRFTPHVENGRGAIGYFSDYAAAAGLEALKDGQYIPKLVRTIREMESSLSADEAPSARVPVIFAGGDCTGTFFHEACGHQLETSHLLMDGVFWDRRGERVASEKVTLIDDGTIPGMYGSSRFDDEGMPRQRNVLIENGVLKGFLADRMGAIKLGVPPSGSGRRQDYLHAATARMSNTFLAAGEDDDEAILRDTPEGLYVTTIGGGTGGSEFTLMATIAYWIKNGQIDRQVKGAMLLGRGDETMKKIDRVGKTLVMEDSGAFCGGDSGFCPTTTSGPRMRVSEMLVGGKGGRT